jgi:magnesium transporter
MAKGSKTAWTHLEAPDDETRRELVRAGVPEILLAHALDPHEVPRIDHEGDHRLVVFGVLERPRRTDASPRTVSLGILVAPDRVYTITRGPTDIEAMISARCGGSPSSPGAVVVEVIAVAADQFIAAAREVDRKVDEIEARLGTSQSNREVLQLLDQQKALVRVMTALRANRVVADRIAEDAHLELDAGARDRLGDARVELHQALEMVTVSTDILGQMMDAFASIISNNLNVVMKALTSLTIVLTGPMIVTSMWGMNVPLPLADGPYAMLVPLAISVIVATAVALWFRRRGWL